VKAPVFRKRQAAQAGGQGTDSDRGVFIKANSETDWNSCVF
jgi:hypothetical protein